jgi:5-methylcytosine-specific restriction endonuclease McrA
LSQSQGTAKTCSKCGLAKPLDQFARRWKDRDVRIGVCKPCRKAYDKAWRERNAEQQRAYKRTKYLRERDERLAAKKARYWADPEAGAAAMRQWRDANPDRVRRIEKKRYHAHRAERLARHRAWILANPERARELKRKSVALRRARIKSVAYEPIDFGLVFERDGGICGICNQPVDPTNWHLDHIKPIALGGPHLYGNVQVTHPRCNQSKGVS